MTEKEALLAAITAGAKTYESARPCVHGHVGKRRTDNGACVGCYEARRAAVKLGRMNESFTARTWTPVAAPVQLAEPIEPRMIRAMNSVLPQFVPAILAGAKLALDSGDIALLLRNIQFAVLLTKRGKTPEQISEALIAARGAA